MPPISRASSRGNPFDWSPLHPGGGYPSCHSHVPSGRQVTWAVEKRSLNAWGVISAYSRFQSVCTRKRCVSLSFRSGSRPCLLNVHRIPVLSMLVMALEPRSREPNHGSMPQAQFSLDFRSRTAHNCPHVLWISGQLLVVGGLLYQPSRSRHQSITDELAQRTMLRGQRFGACAG